MIPMFAVGAPAVAEQPKNVVPALRKSDMQDVPPESIPVGESVCVFALTVSAEGHLWIPKTQFYKASGCSLTGTRTVDGWRVNLHGIKLVPHPELRDEWLKSTRHYIRATEVIP
jgi:hypothetical protein